MKKVWIIIGVLGVASIGGYFIYSAIMPPDYEVYTGLDHEDGILREGIFQRCFEWDEVRPEKVDVFTWGFTRESYSLVSYSNSYLINNNLSASEMSGKGASSSVLGSNSFQEQVISNGKIQYYKERTNNLGDPFENYQYSPWLLPSYGDYCIEVMTSGGITVEPKNLTTGWVKVAKLNMELFDFTSNDGKGNYSWTRHTTSCIANDGYFNFPSSTEQVGFYFEYQHRDSSHYSVDNDKGTIGEFQASMGEILISDNLNHSVKYQYSNENLSFKLHNYHGSLPPFLLW